MRHPKALDWEKKLKVIFDEIDQQLETEYRSLFPLHPARPAEGETTNPEMDGLFNVGASFSAGFGSKFGPGYVVDIRLSTLQEVPPALREELREKVKAYLQTRLPEQFPGQHLLVNEEGAHLRIHGDLGLES